MPIVDAKIIDGPNVQVDGQHRGVIEFVLDDGRKIRQPVRAANVVEWAALPDQLSADVLKAVVREDAAEAVALGLTVGHKQASQNDVYFAWMQAAFNESDPVVAYDTMKGVAPVLVAMGLTAEQYAGAFDADVEQVQRLLDRWAYLSSKTADIEAARALKAADV